MEIERHGAAVLDDWRAVERDIEALPVGTPEWWALHDEVTRLRDEYQRLFDEALARHDPPLPPFPTTVEPEADPE